MKRLVLIFSLLLPFLALGDAPSFTTKTYHEVHGKGLVRKQLEQLKATSVPWVKKAYGPIKGPIDISASVSLCRNQGSCGSCWAYSLTKALQSQYQIAGITLPGLLDTNYLIGNCGGSVSEGGCGGGDFPAAANFESGVGPWGNGVDPGTGSCKNLPAVATALSHTMLGGSAGPMAQDIAAFLTPEGDGVMHMISVDVAAGDGSWENYSSGVYNGCSGSANDIDHMIDVVGFDCPKSRDANGILQFDSTGRCTQHDEVLIEENNWAESWGTTAGNGHGGYMYSLMYGTNGQKCNAIATDALVFNIKEPVPPTPPNPPVPPTPPASSVPLWVWIAAGVAVLAFVLGLVAILKKD